MTEAQQLFFDDVTHSVTKIMTRVKRPSISVLSARAVINRSELNHQIPLLPGTDPLHSRFQYQHEDQHQIDDNCGSNDVFDTNQNDSSDSDTEDIVHITIEYERLVVANEAMWKNARSILRKEMLLRLFPSFDKQCSSCQSNNASVYCQTCSSFECQDCCITTHGRLFCHALFTENNEYGLSSYTLPIKKLHDCPITCITSTKSNLVTLVNLNCMSSYF